MKRGTMHGITDSDHLRDKQYRNASNLNARVELHRRFSTNPIDWQQWVFEQLDLPQNARILEVGAGPALLWRHLVSQAEGTIPAGWQITLSDFSAGMVETQRSSLAHSQHPFEYQIIDLREPLPFADGLMDAVIANHMLYHIDDVEAALREIWRVLKPGGRLYAATNGQAHIAEIWQFILQYIPEPPSADDYVYHLSFSLENGAEKLKAVFGDKVQMRLAEGHLKVTEAQPLIDYIGSGMTEAQLTPEIRQQMLTDFTAQIEHEGSIHITKSTGLFIAEK